MSDYNKIIRYMKRIPGTRAETCLKTGRSYLITEGEDKISVSCDDEIWIRVNPRYVQHFLDHVCPMMDCNPIITMAEIQYLLLD